jgi:hypothetical protein
MDMGFDPALLEALLPDFDDVDDDDMDPDDRRRCWHSQVVPRRRRPAHLQPLYASQAVPWLFYRLPLHLHSSRGAVPVAAAAPVATRAPMATPPHMAPVTVGGVTVDPRCVTSASPTTSRCWTMSR